MNKIAMQSIAHDINTPLTYVKGSLELLKLDLDDENAKKVSDHLALMEEGIDRITKTIELIRKIYEIQDEE